MTDRFSIGKGLISVDYCLMAKKLNRNKSKHRLFSFDRQSRRTEAIVDEHSTVLHADFSRQTFDHLSRSRFSVLEYINEPLNIETSVIYLSVD